MGGFTAFPSSSTLYVQADLPRSLGDWTHANGVDSFTLFFGHSIQRREAESLQGPMPVIEPCHAAPGHNGAVALFTS